MKKETYLIKYALAGLGIILVGFILLVWLVPPAPPIVENTSTHNLTGDVVVKVSPGHPTNEEEFNAMKASQGAT